MQETTNLDWAKGGINMPDIESSWACFKLLWFRRLYNSQGVWTKLYSECLRELGIEHYQPLEFHLLTFAEIKMIANKAKNSFWKGCFKIVEDLFNEFIISNPKLILKTNVWGSQHFKTNNVVLKKSQHRYMEQRVYCIGDICLQNNDSTYEYL